jgi:hypothetical protein
MTQTAVQILAQRTRSNRLTLFSEVGAAGKRQLLKLWPLRDDLVFAIVDGLPWPPSEDLVFSEVGAVGKRQDIC